MEMDEDKSYFPGRYAKYKSTSPVYLFGIENLQIDYITNDRSILGGEDLTIGFKINNTADSLGKLLEALKQRFGYPTSITKTMTYESPKLSHEWIDVDITSIDSPKSLIPPESKNVEPYIDQYSITYGKETDMQQITIYVDTDYISFILNNDSD